MTGSSRRTRCLCTDLEGHRLCEARDRYHYGIAAGIHPAARALGTAEQQQDLSDALELKKRQECAAKAGIRQMTETVILPEARQRQITSFHKAIPAHRTHQKVSGAFRHGEGCHRSRQGRRCSGPRGTGRSYLRTFHFQAVPGRTGQVRLPVHGPSRAGRGTGSGRRGVHGIFREHPAIPAQFQAAL